MNLMPVSEESKSAILKAIAQELAPVGVAGVEVTPDFDHDGEEILRIVVLLQNDKPEIEGGKLLSASVKAQKTLSAVNDGRFAVIDFVSASEAEQVIE